jgi:hypothetical protein
MSWAALKHSRSWGRSLNFQSQERCALVRVSSPSAPRTVWFYENSNTLLWHHKWVQTYPFLRTEAYANRGVGSTATNFRCHCIIVKNSAVAKTTNLQLLWKIHADIAGVNVLRAISSGFFAEETCWYMQECQVHGVICKINNIQFTLPAKYWLKHWKKVDVSNLPRSWSVYLVFNNIQWTSYIVQPSHLFLNMENII